MSGFQLDWRGWLLRGFCVGRPLHGVHLPAGSSVRHDSTVGGIKFEGKKIIFPGP